MRIFTFAVGATAVALWSRLTFGSTPYLEGRQGWIAFVVVAALFGLAEVFSVHLHFMRNSHTYSLFEIPLTLGLFFAPARALIAAHLVGSGLALVFHRRQPLLKLAFNLTAMVIVDAVAVGVFRSLAGPPGRFGMAAVAGAWAGTLVASAVSSVLVVAVIALAEGPVGGGWRSTVLFGGASAVVSTSLGLIAVGLIAAYPSVSWLLIVPTAALYLASQAYVGERRRHQGIGFLHDSTTMLLESAELETALVRLVDHARAVFKAGFAELAYLPRQDTDIVDVTSDESSARTHTRPVGGSPLESIMARVGQMRAPLLLDRRLCTPEEAEFLDERTLTDAMLAPLCGEDRVCGLLIMGNRLGDVAHFDHEDAVVLATFAANITVALENNRLEQSLDDLRQIQQRLTHQATHDSLTDLANRSLFTSNVVEALGRCDSIVARVAVMFIDLDDFKTVNDSLGHAAGDELLVVVGRRLRAAVPPSATAARLGGDEFAIVIPDVTNVDEVMRQASRLLTTLSSPVAVVGHVVPTGASIGVAVSTPGQGAAALLRDADTAMYSAKGNGKHCIALFEPSLHEAAAHRYNVTFELARAISEDEFVVHYQPIVDLAQRTVAGAEALVRWQHPTMGLLAPGAFLPIAEESDAIVRIGRAVLEDVCQYLVTERDPVLGCVSVNLSARDLLEPSLAADLRAMIASYRIDPSVFVVDVTEGLMIADLDAAMRGLSSLKDIGVRIALDDFGTGYSSLSYLRRLPLDMLKIAQPFVDDLGRASGDTRFIEAIINLGHALGLTIVAEGIEHAEQAEVLASLNCQFGQGYHFARPVPAGDFPDVLRRLGQALGGQGIGLRADSH